MFLGIGITTSRRQRQAGKGLSEGSRSAKKRAPSHAKTEAPLKDDAYGTDHADLFGATGCDDMLYVRLRHACCRRPCQLAPHAPKKKWAVHQTLAELHS
jgi:hypothetical protein